MNPEERVFDPGDVIAERYEIVEELGRGSYGVVFRAIQLGIGRDVAIKTLLPHTMAGSEEHKRFEREALAVSRFNHPNIVTLYDYGEFQGVFFMVMEYVQGRPLREVIEAEAPLEPQRVRSITYQMLDALQYAHEQGVVHRDLKPANIQLIPQSSFGSPTWEQVKVLDFGIAKFVYGEEDDGSPLDTLTQTGVAMGTPQYMSPENIIGDPVSHHTDLYSVGLLMYEMLVGEPAFAGKSPHEVMVAHIKDNPPRLPRQPHLQPFSRAVLSALQKQPDERVPTARHLRELLELDAPQPAVQQEAGGQLVASDDNRLLKPLIAVVVAAALVLILLVLVLFYP